MKASLAFAAWALLLAACAPGTAPAAVDTFPPLSGRVVDRANLLTPAQEGALDQRLEALEGQTSDQLVVVTVTSLGGRPIEDYTRDLGNHWGIGQRERNNGVLLVVAPNERKTRIAVGRGLERVISNADAATIIERDLMPRFRRSDYFGGIDVATRSIAVPLLTREAAPAEVAR